MSAHPSGPVAKANTGMLASFAALALAVAALLAALTPTSSLASLQLLQPNASVRATFFGKGGFSSDGLGQNGVGGTVQADVPNGSTVVQAYLYGSYYANTQPDATARTINFDGTNVILQTLPNSEAGRAGLSTARAVVTAQVAAKVGAGEGITNFSVNTDPSTLDGVALVVIFSNPNLPDTTVAVVEGGSKQTGDQVTFNFANAINPTQPGFLATMAIGSGFSYQGVAGHGCGKSQYSILDINGQLLTNCAGNYDDGIAANSGLITVGGVGDSFDNPTPPGSPATDDELYDLKPFLSAGDTQLLINMTNPSQDDNLFLAIIATTGQAQVTTEVCDNGVDDDGDGLIDANDPDCDDGRIVFASNRDGTYNYEIYSMNPDGTGQTRLTNNSAIDYSPSRLPRRSRRSPSPPTATATHYEIYVMNADGTGPDPPDQRAAVDNNPAWSPDGQKLVFASNREDGQLRDLRDERRRHRRRPASPTARRSTVARPARPTGTDRLHIRPRRQLRDLRDERRRHRPDAADHNSATETTPCVARRRRRSPSLQPRRRQPRDLPMNADGTAQTRLTTSSTVDNNPAFSPDGTKLVFNSNRDGNRRDLPDEPRRHRPDQADQLPGDRLPARLGVGPRDSPLHVHRHRPRRRLDEQRPLPDLHLPLDRAELHFPVLDRHRLPQLRSPALATAASHTPAMPAGQRHRFFRVERPDAAGNTDQSPATRSCHGQLPVSRNGKIVFASNRDGNSLEIYVDERRRHRPDAPHQQRRRSTTAAWSPDGKKIAFDATATATTRST